MERREAPTGIRCQSSYALIERVFTMRARMRGVIRAQIDEERAREEQHIQRELQPHSWSRQGTGPEAAAVERETSKQRGRQRGKKYYREDSDCERSDPPGPPPEQHETARDLKVRMFDEAHPASSKTATKASFFI
jgi:hypothetical protein